LAFSINLNPIDKFTICIIHTTIVSTRQNKQPARNELPARTNSQPDEPKMCPAPVRGNQRQKPKNVEVIDAAGNTPDAVGAPTVSHIPHVYVQIEIKHIHICAKYRSSLVSPRGRPKKTGPAKPPATPSVSISVIHKRYIVHHASSGWTPNQPRSMIGAKRRAFS